MSWTNKQFSIEPTAVITEIKLFTSHIKSCHQIEPRCPNRTHVHMCMAHTTPPHNLACIGFSFQNLHNKNMGIMTWWSFIFFTMLNMSESSALVGDSARTSPPLVNRKKYRSLSEATCHCFARPFLFQNPSSF
jgi:hypothetical protein